jgi:hypothetical protein
VVATIVEDKHNLELGKDREEKEKRGGGKRMGKSWWPWFN